MEIVLFSKGIFPGIYGKFRESIYKLSVEGRVGFSIKFISPILGRIVLGTSNWDICFDANLKLSKVLSDRNVHHWLDIRQERKHDWPVWNEMFPHYLSRIKFF